MKRARRSTLVSIFALLTIVSPPAALAKPEARPVDAAALAEISKAALQDDVAWDIAEGLTTEIGPRLAASESDVRARNWAVAKLKSLGFSNVHVETFPMTRWIRGREHAEILAPFPQALTLTALGGSASTPPGGVDGDIVAFDNLAAFAASDPAAVKGKIVFVSHAMANAHEMNAYMTFGALRRKAPELAAERGALAVLIRSVGTDYHRNPHTGTGGPSAPLIPSAALSIPDAEQLSRIVARGKPVRLRLALESRMEQNGESGNVIAEVPGSEPAAGIVLVGGHLDSWDLGTGAVDDAAGLAIVTAAVSRVKALGKPRRTIRIIWFGAEEPGLIGAQAYAKAHPTEPFAVAAEADAGAGAPLSFETSVRPEALSAFQPLREALERLGVAKGHGNGAAEGSDIGVFARQGVPVTGFSQDLSLYFQLHHTPDDTLDKIDPGELRHNVAVWSAMLAFLANDDTQLGPFFPVPAQ